MVGRKGPMDRPTTSNAFDLWGKQYKSVVRWVGRIQRKNMAAFDLYRFCQWAGKTPDELLALKDDSQSMDAEVLLDDFKLNEEYGVSVRYRILVNVKSFFKSNYKQVAKLAGIVEYDKQKPYHKLTKEDLRRVWRMCYNPRDRFLFSLFFSSGIARESATHLTWGHLEDGWEGQNIVHLSLEPHIIKGHGRGKYKGVRQETFITPEAKRDLLEYKAWIEDKIDRRVKKSDPLIFATREPFGSIGYTRISNMFADLKRRSGVILSPHDGRRWVENALENAGIHTNRCRKIRGRKVRGEEAPYSQPAIEELRADYAKALPDLEFQRETTLLEIRRRQEVAEAIMDKLVRGEHLTDEDRSNIKRYGIRLRERGKRATDGGSTCFGERYEQIHESELLEHLRAGWQVVHRLQSGEVIVRK